MINNIKRLKVMKQRLKKHLYNETRELTHVFVNTEEIVSTPKHTFYSPSKGWTSAEDLRAGGYTCTFKRRICNS